MYEILGKFMTVQIKNKAELLSLLKAMDKEVTGSKRTLLSRIAEAYWIWMFGLLASFVLHFFHISGWGLQFLVYVIVVETLTLTSIMGSIYQLRHGSLDKPQDSKIVQLAIISVAFGLTVAFVLLWDIPIQKLMFAVVWVAHLITKKMSVHDSNVSLKLMDYLNRSDYKILMVILATYNARREDKGFAQLFKNPEYQERFFNVSLHGLERFYGHPDDVENIIRDMKTIYISMVQELRKNS